MPYSTLAIYSLAVCAASLAGGALPVFLRITHQRMQLILSFVGGLMLGVGVLHLLPHAVAATNSIDTVFISLLCGILLTFALIRVFHIHQHEPVAAEHPTQEECDHDPACEHHQHHHHHDDDPAGGNVGWFGLLAGLSLHTLIDGAALGADVFSNHGHAALPWVGLGTFLAVVLHKPLDALALTSLMKAQGFSSRRTSIVSFIFSLMCPLGAFAFAFGVRGLFSDTSLALAIALAFAAGAFLCISLADLLPEIQFHRHDRWQLSGALLFGVFLAYGIGFLEPEHAHHAGATAPHAADVHNHPAPADGIHQNSRE